MVVLPFLGIWSNRIEGKFFRVFFLSVLRLQKYKKIKKLPKFWVHSKIMGGRKFLQRVTLKNEDNEIFSEKIMFFFVDLSIFASDKVGVDFGDLRQKWAYYIRNIGKLSESDLHAFEFRMHGAHLGCFWSVDLRADKYPWNSAYVFAENRVICGFGFMQTNFIDKNRNLGKINR